MQIHDPATSATVEPPLHYSNVYGMTSRELLVEFATGERLFARHDPLTGGWVQQDGETRWDALHYWNTDEQPA